MVRLTDHPDVTLAVYRGRETTTRSGHIFSFLLPLIQEGQLLVTAGDNMYTKYWLTA